MDIRWPWHYLIEAFTPSTKGFQGHPLLDAFAQVFLVILLFAEALLVRIVFQERAEYLEVGVVKGVEGESLERWLLLATAPLPYIVLCVLCLYGRWMKACETAASSAAALECTPAAPSDVESD